MSDLAFALAAWKSTGMTQTSPEITETTPQPPPHGVSEDAFAFVVGTLLAALGVHFLKSAHLATGGTAGIAFLLHYLSALPIGAALFLVNLPFYVFAWKAMGRGFTLRTMAAVALLSAESFVLPSLVRFDGLNPAFAAVMAGLMVGTGLLVLVRHRASLGGIGVLAYFLQNRYGIRAGHVQMAFDCVITGTALLILPVSDVALSVLGAVALNLVLSLNHRPGRYMGV
jgi:uncharacterized membrane-anchored protein YitT (DUF2179 family)